MEQYFLWILFSFLIFGFCIAPIIRKIAAFYYNRILYKTPINLKNYNWSNHILENWSPWYKQLDLKARAKILNRIYNRIKYTQFITSDGGTPSPEQILKISSSLEQLCYGLDIVERPLVEKVSIHPTIYYSRLLKADVKGLTLGNKLVTFSWEDFEDGFKIHDDNINLAIHEWGHLLYIEAYKRKNLSLNIYNKIINCLKMAENVKRVFRPELGEFRAYGKTNLAEFFSVSLEYFFENPQKFKNEYPAYFESICRLLNQNPLNINQNYLYQLIRPEKQILEFIPFSPRLIAISALWLLTIYELGYVENDKLLVEMSLISSGLFLFGYNSFIRFESFNIFKTLIRYFGLALPFTLIIIGLLYLLNQ